MVSVSVDFNVENQFFAECVVMEARHSDLHTNWTSSCGFESCFDLIEKIFFSFNA